MEPRIISHKWSEEPQKQNVPLGTLQHNTELVKRNFINLRTVRASLFHLLSPMSLSYFSSFHLWFFSLFSMSFSPVLVCIPSFNKNTFLLLLIKSVLFFSQWFYLLLSFFPGHSHPFLATILLSFFALAGHFSLALLSTSVLPVWCFLFFNLCLPEEIKFSHLESYTFLFPILAVLPFLTPWVILIPSHLAALQTCCILTH